MQRIARLPGKYDYTSSENIQSRINQALSKAKTNSYFRLILTSNEEDQTWELHWERHADILAKEECFDGMMLVCSNVPP